MVLRCPGLRVVMFLKDSAFNFILILKAKKSTPNIMLYGELGRYPITIATKARMIGFWQRIINGKTDKISYKLYKSLLGMHLQDLFHSKWLLNIKTILH